MNMRGGGVGVVLRNTFNVTNHTNAGSYQLFEYIELFLKLSTAPVRLVVLYRPPGANISAFCDEFANYLEYLSISPGYLLLVGDFNIHVDCFEDDNAVKFLNLLDSFNMTQHVNGATHNNDHTLDLVITRCDEQFVRNLCIHDPDLSDHLAVIGKLLFAKPSFEKKEILFRNLKSIDMETFRRDLSNSDFLNQTGDHDLSGLISSYNHTLKSLLDLHAPIKRRIDFHGHYTRFVSNLNLRRPLIHNNYGASTFTFIASKIWETIPLYLKKLYYYAFSKQYKLYLLNSQSVP